jgi:protein TonB
VVLAAAALLLGPKLLNPRTDPQPAAKASSPSPASSDAQTAPPKQEATPAPAAAESKPSATKQRSEHQTAKAVAPAPAPAPAVTTAPLAGGSDHGKVLQQVEPVVSKSARNTVSGTIRIRVKVEVDAAGNVERATFITEGPSKYFARQSMEAAQQWKFAPAQVNGQAVPSAWVLHFGFRRSGIEINSEPAKR